MKTIFILALMVAFAQSIPLAMFWLLVGTLLVEYYNHKMSQNQ